MSGRPSVSLQEAAIGSNLNSSLLLQYLVGIYIGVYFITIYLYRPRRSPSITFVTGCLTALFGVVIYECFSQCFFGTNDVPKWIPVLSIIANDAGYVIADGLMIWRCFHVTNHSMSRLALPLLFFSTEIVLAVTENVIYILLNFKPGWYNNNTEHARLFDKLDASMGFVTATTSLLATFTIARQIYMVTINQSLRRRYIHIIEIAIQSSIVYSLAVLSMAICNIFLFATGNPYTILTASTIIRYLDVIGIIVTGLSPTLMVARLALASDQSSNLSTGEYSVGTQAINATTLDSDTTVSGRSEALRSSEWEGYEYQAV